MGNPVSIEVSRSQKQDARLLLVAMDAQCDLSLDEEARDKTAINLVPLAKPLQEMLGAISHVLRGLYTHSEMESEH